jgi:hypothetical protein
LCQLQGTNDRTVAWRGLIVAGWKDEMAAGWSVLLHNGNISAVDLAVPLAVLVDHLATLQSPESGDRKLCCSTFGADV